MFTNEIELQILKFWKDKDIFKKSLRKNKGRKNFVFYEGPPTANGKPGIHHILARSFKDVICRFKTMKGFYVLRRGGWDTHGLPVELEVEKKLGLENKRDIERFGIKKFNEMCRQSVWEYKTEWEKLTERMAYWIDLENAYITYDPNYIESVWYILSFLYKKGYLQKGYKVLPYCPRCGTPLSSHEVALGYKKVKDKSIYVKFEIKDKEFAKKLGFQEEKIYLIIWTTTPWTLPANVLVAGNKNIKYVAVKVGNEVYILSKKAKDSIFPDISDEKEIDSKNLYNLEYKPPYNVLESFNVKPKRSHYVVFADYVSDEDGSGFVHIAPAFGQEDMDVVEKENKKNKVNLPVLITLEDDGAFKKIKGLEFIEGKFVKEADPLIVQDLQNKKLLLKEQVIEHEYPFCWRCKSPLLYFARDSWFVKTTLIKDKIIKNNKTISWVPTHLKEGRFGEWLKDLKDWAISRERYWGTPLPIWICEKCGNQKVLSSKSDIEKQKFTTNTFYILRHGQSLRNVYNFVSCWPEVRKSPLTKEGIAQAKEAGKKLKGKIDIIFTSDLERTMQTAQIVAEETGCKVLLAKELREVNEGIFNGKKTIEVFRYFTKKYGKELSKEEYYLMRFREKVPGGESLSELQKRVLSFIKRINKKYKNKRILLVSHELPLTILECSMKGMSPIEIIKFREKKMIKTAEVRKIDFKILPYNDNSEIDFHRPYIDEVEFLCDNCSSLMKRVPDVLDCWFDSGSMPFAQWHYPFENKDLIDKRKQFPADYISEAIDQTRGWFYTLLAVSTFLKGVAPYKNVVSLGHVLDEKGEKMSKSKGNVVDPWQMAQKYTIDSVRWYFFTVNQPGEPKLFSEKALEAVYKKFILTTFNVINFLKLYSNEKVKIQTNFSKNNNILDKWILSKINSLTFEVTKDLESYKIVDAARKIENFVVDDLSQWYVRRSRDRFRESGSDFNTAFSVLFLVLKKLSIVMAPFVPFLGEYVYQQLKNINEKGFKESVHLENYFKPNRKLINKKLELNMEKIRELVNVGLNLRQKAKIKVRQPLLEIYLHESLRKIVDKDMQEILKGELNVKRIVFFKDRNEIKKDKVTESDENKDILLNIEITPELQNEGEIREFVRNIQNIRKKMALIPKDLIIIEVSGDEKSKEFIEMNKEVLKEVLKAKDLVFYDNLTGKYDTISIGDKKFNIKIKLV
ncbi:Isoleucine--tRNA ligase [bacterium HR34]|nr:Isoleucine--tRNA ligase [bacterium HR34]